MGVLPSWVAGWVGYLGHLHRLSIASLAGHMAQFRAPTAATLPRGYFSAFITMLQGGDAGSDLSENKYPGGFWIGAEVALGGAGAG